MKNKIAICGHTSSSGRYFMNRYKGKYDFICIGRKDAELYLDLRDSKISGDLNKLNSCKALVNFCAQTQDKTSSEINDMMKVNVLGPLFLADLVTRFNIPRLIHISSISALYTKDDCYYSYYSQSKKYADELLSYYCENNNIDYCILRPSSLFGTDDFAIHQKLIYGIINSIKNDNDVVFWGNNNAKRNYISIETLSEVIEKLVDSRINGIYPVVNTKNNSLTEIANALNDFLNGKSKIFFDSSKPDVMSCEFNDDGKIFDLLQIKKPDGLKGELQKQKVL